MDFDDLDIPSQATSRVSRFAPKSSKLKPKKEPELVPKLEPQQIDLTAKQNFETIVPTQTKLEPNDIVKIDVESKSEVKEDSRNVDSMDVEMTEAEEDSTQVNPINENNEEDTIVREIDVFFSPSINDNTKLYIMQYPLRPSWRPYELDERCEEVRLKPESSEVEVDLSVDFESSNIDRDVSNKLKYTKQILSTTWKPPAANGCAVGLLMGDKLHLHPIHAVVQLRPSRNYLDSGGSEKKNVAMSNQNNQMVPSTSDGDQRWVPLKYHDCKSDMSSRYFQQMVTQENSPINFEMSAYDYIATLCPGVSRDTLAKGPSKRYLLSLPVEKRLETLLIDGPTLHRFSAIKHFVTEYSNDELLSFLQQNAQLLQGYWVPKSRLLYPKGSAESLARNYVLVLFNKRLKVMPADVTIKKGELATRVKQFLMQFAFETKDLKGVSYWKFKEVPDESFIKEFPNVVKQQEEIFKILDKEVSSEVGNVGKHKPGKSVVRKGGVKNALVR